MASVPRKFLVKGRQYFDIVSSLVVVQLEPAAKS